MEDFASYFTKDAKIMLEKVNYESYPTLPKFTAENKRYFDVNLDYPAGIKAIFTKHIILNLFILSVSFSATLKFNSEKRDLVDWKSVDLTQGFIEGFPSIISTLNARASLLVAEITSSSGNEPIIPTVSRIPEMAESQKKLLKFQQLMTFLSKSGCSVTQRIKKIKQPRGGYIKPESLTTFSLGEGMEQLNPAESIHPLLMGLVVDYLTRFMLGSPVENAFRISMLGARMIKEEDNAKKLMIGIKGLDSRSVINAAKMCGYDVCYRAGTKGYKPVDGINPDNATIENITVMVNRSLSFFEKYGPKILDGFTFEGGYSDIVDKGDGDFTTKDTLWDFKVSKAPIKKEHTLQLLMYWRMGLHSIHPEFQNIRYLGIFNPRQNTVSRIAVTDIPDEIIRQVETDVIGYKNV